MKLTRQEIDRRVEQESTEAGKFLYGAENFMKDKTDWKRRRSGGHKHIWERVIGANQFSITAQVKTRRFMARYEDPTGCSGLIKNFATMKEAVAFCESF